MVVGGIICMGDEKMCTRPMILCTN